MSRHPVQDDTDALLVQIIHEELEIVRSPETRRGRIVIGNLVSPGTAEGMFHDGHEFHVRKTHFLHVVGQLDGHFPVSQGPVAFLRHPSPGFRVHFINGERPLPRIAFGTFFHPGLVLELVTRAEYDRGGLGGLFSGEGVGVALEKSSSTVKMDFVLVTGKTVVFDWWTPKDDDWGLYTRPVSGGGPKLFAKSEDGIAYSPKWSPDGKWIALLRSGTPRTSELFIKAVSENEERVLGQVCSDGVAWTADSRQPVAPNSGDTDMLENCRLTVVSIEPGNAAQQLTVSGNEPALSPDGKTVAFVKARELHLLPLTPDGRAAGPEKTLIRESIAPADPVWVPGNRDIVYELGRDRSVIRRIEAREGARARNTGSGSIDGDFNLLSFSPNEGPVLAEVASHDDSFWRVDLQGAQTAF